MAAFIDKFQRFCGSRTLAWLIMANVTVFLISWAVILSGGMMGKSGNFTMSWLCVPSSPEAFIRHPWTAVTYMATHYDFLHLLFNMLWLYWFGVMLFPSVSGNRLLLLYAGGGLAGAALYVAASAILPPASSGAYLCGASASVLAIMTTAAVISPDRRINLFLLGSVKLKWITIGCIVLTFLGLGGGNPGSQAAHIGGVVFGFAFPFMIRRKAFVKTASKVRVAMPKVKETAVRTVRLNVRRDGAAVATAAGQRLSDSRRLDMLLDKIRISGYASLTAGERNELNELSQRIDKIRENSGNNN
ncbi:MAG: rhomboid family intramembrane serine protease [Muribaculaceae bacterium]